MWKGEAHFKTKLEGDWTKVHIQVSSLAVESEEQLESFDRCKKQQWTQVLAQR